MKKPILGKLINNAGHGNYTNSDAPEKVIRYVTRTNGKSKDELIVWGGLGILECNDVESIINQFCITQKLYTRRGSFGRYIDHEFFSFSPKGEYILSQNNLDIDKIARKMAYDIYEQDHCQVIYGVHAPDKNESHLHIHFVINTVNFHTGNKRRENIHETAEREKRFQKIIWDEITSMKN